MNFRPTGWESQGKMDTLLQTIPSPMLKEAGNMISTNPSTKVWLSLFNSAPGMGFGVAGAAATTTTTNTTSTTTYF